MSKPFMQPKLNSGVSSHILLTNQTSQQCSAIEIDNGESLRGEEHWLPYTDGRERRSARLRRTEGGSTGWWVTVQAEKVGVQIKK